MQGNGFKIFLIGFFLVLSGYYLYPSAQGYFLNRTLDSLDEAERSTYEQDNVSRIRSIQEKSLKPKQFSRVDRAVRYGSSS